MNVYDFDNTIYRGDSTNDFVRWCMRKKPYLAYTLVRSGISFWAYRSKICSKTEFKEALFAFLKHIPDPDKMIKEFWDEHLHNIKSWYIRNQREDDLIISASPDFLVRPACERLGISHLLASNVDKTTGFYLGINCFGAEKVRRFLEKYNEEIDEFYSDSLSDSPLAHMAKKAYLVDGDVLTPWKE